MIVQLLQRLFCTHLGTLLFLAATVSLLAYHLRGYIRQLRLAYKLRGPKPIPLLGNCLVLANKNLMIEETSQAFERYGSIVRVWLTILPAFAILEPEHIQLVLSSKKHTDKLFVYRFMHNFLGKGLITSNGEEWRQHRRLLQPSFHLSILEKFIQSFGDGANTFCKRIEPRCSVAMNITEFVNDCVLDVLNETVFGISIKNKPVKREKDITPYRQGTILLPYRLSKPWLMLDWLYDLTDAASKEVKQKSKLDDCTRNRVAERRKALQQGTAGRPCLVDLMLEVSEKHPDFTEEDIINEANTFMLAGQDSVGASVAFTLFLLAKHKDHQQMCYDELRNIFQDDDQRTPSMNDLREMKYLEQCIKESLRLYPSVPLLARKITEDIEMGKHTLPANSLVVFSVYSTHRLPHIYPDPERFDPDRFSPQNCEKRNPYAFIGFAAGPRICLGYKYAMLEMKTIISRILRSYTMETIPGKEEIKPAFRITLRAQGGLWIRFEKRNDSEKI